MKSSIGSLAALAAVAAPVLSEAAPVTASFSNVAISFTSQDIDIDGNGSNDFSVFANSFLAFVQASSGSNFVVPSEFNEGDTVTVAAASSASWDFSKEPSDVTYVGVSFERNAAAHAAWLRFETDAGNNLVLTGGAWESGAGAGILIPAAIPEPSAAAAWAGMAGLLATLCRRRRHRGA